MTNIVQVNLFKVLRIDKLLEMENKIEVARN
jgi:hypothetical protein